MKTKYFALALVPAFALMLVPQANASGLRSHFIQSVDASVTTLDSGYEATFTSDNPYSVNHLQDQATYRAENDPRENVATSVNYADDGVTVVRLSTNEHQGNRLERRSEHPKRTIYRSRNR